MNSFSLGIACCASFMVFAALTTLVYLLFKPQPQKAIPIHAPNINSFEHQQPTTPATKKDKAIIEQSLHAFRAGTPEERKQAMLALSQLGEVEKF